MATRVVAMEYWQAVEYSYHEIERGTRGAMAKAVAALEAHPGCRALQEILAKGMDSAYASVSDESVVALCTRHVSGEPPLCPIYAYAGCGGTAAGLIAAFAMPVPLDGKPCIRVDLSGRWDVAYSFDTLKSPGSVAAAIAGYVNKGVIRYCPRSHEFLANPEWAIDSTPRCMQAVALERLCADAMAAGLQQEGIPRDDVTPFESLLAFGGSLLKACTAMKERLAMYERLSAKQAAMLNVTNDNLRRMLFEVDINYPRGERCRQDASTACAQSLNAPALSADVQNRLTAVMQAVEGWRSRAADAVYDKAMLSDEVKELTQKHTALMKNFDNMDRSYFSVMNELRQEVAEYQQLSSANGGFARNRGVKVVTGSTQTVPWRAPADSPRGPADGEQAERGVLPGLTATASRSESAMAGGAPTLPSGGLATARARSIAGTSPGATAREISGARLPQHVPEEADARRDPFHTPLGGMVGWFLLALWYIWMFGFPNPFQASGAAPGAQAADDSGQFASGVASSSGAHKLIAEGGCHFTGMPVTRLLTPPSFGPLIGNMLGNHSL